MLVQILHAPGANWHAITHYACDLDNRIFNSQKLTWTRDLPSGPLLIVIVSYHCLRRAHGLAIGLECACHPRLH